MHWSDQDSGCGGVSSAPHACPGDLIVHKIRAGGISTTLLCDQSCSSADVSSIYGGVQSKSLREPELVKQRASFLFIPFTYAKQASVWWLQQFHFSSRLLLYSGCSSHFFS